MFDYSCYLVILWGSVGIVYFEPFFLHYGIAFRFWHLQEITGFQFSSISENVTLDRKSNGIFSESRANVSVLIMLTLDNHSHLLEDL